MLRIGTLILMTALVALGLVLASCERSPAIAFDRSVPADLQALASATWDEFIEFHPARLDCLRPATLAASWDLESRGEYRPDSSLVVVRVPGTAATLRHEMVHEFAHHIEFTCDDHRDVRAAFLQAQGFSTADSWFDGKSWETTPSEQYAEATVELVLGRRHHHGSIFITDHAAEVVRRWATGA